MKMKQMQINLGMLGPLLMVLSLPNHAFGQDTATANTIAEAAPVSVPQQGERQSLSKMCDLDYANSCRNLGLMWERGLGGNSDIAMAEAKYDKSCKLNYYPACTDLARLLVSDKVDFNRRKRGITILGTNCDINDYQACSLLGIESFRSGLYANARYLLEKSCDDGQDANACHNLGLAYMAGNNPEWGKAKEATDKACKMGAEDACNNSLSYAQ